MSNVPSRPLRIVIADDNDADRELATMRMVERDHDVTCVTNGQELLKLLEHGPAGFDVIVTDNDMPGGPSGLAVLKILRVNPLFNDTPIILQSRNTGGSLSLEVEEHRGIFAPKNGTFSALLRVLDDLFA